MILEKFKKIHESTVNTTNKSPTWQKSRNIHLIFLQLFNLSIKNKLFDIILYLSPQKLWVEF
jgi:hypothetical protein